MMNYNPFAGKAVEGNPLDVSFWMSFSPMAPLFGVKYRYADMFKFDQAFAPNFDLLTPKKAVVKPAKKAKPAAKPKAKAVAPKKAVTAKKAEAPKKAEVAKKVEAPKPVAAPKAVKVEPIEKPKAKAVKQAPVETKTVEAKIEAAPAKVEAATDRPATLFDAPPAKVDDLKLIKGVGPKLEGMLNGLGIYTFEQIAGFSQAELQWVDENLTSFKGRAFRDDWIAQAKGQMA